VFSAAVIINILARKRDCKFRGNPPPDSEMISPPDSEN
jgi:hypothetical protein